MEIFTSPIILIIVGLVIVVLGIGAGMLLSSLNEESEPQESDPDQAPPGGRKGRYKPVARLWRARDSGALIVEMDGKSFVAPTPLSAEQQVIIQQASLDLLKWLGMGIEPPASMAHVTASGKPPHFVDHQAEQPAASAPGKTGALVFPPVPAIPAEEPAVAAGKPASMLMQIDEILQEMIVGTPLANQGVHLIEDPVRGVLVRVGLNHYEGIDAVPDPQIKATIRAAVAEWEKTQ